MSQGLQMIRAILDNGSQETFRTLEDTDSERAAAFCRAAGEFVANSGGGACDNGEAPCHLVFSFGLAMSPDAPQSTALQPVITASSWPRPEEAGRWR